MKYSAFGRQPCLFKNECSQNKKGLLNTVNIIKLTEGLTLITSEIRLTYIQKTIHMYLLYVIFQIICTSSCPVTALDYDMRTFPLTKGNNSLLPS